MMSRRVGKGTGLSSEYSRTKARNDASQYFSHGFRRRNLVNRYPSNCARPTSNKRISRIEVKIRLTFAALRPSSRMRETAEGLAS